MIKTLKYKNYTGSIEVTPEDDCLHGKILGIKSLLSYEGQNLKELTADFESLIDEYLEDCKNEGIEPEKPFKGCFNVRIDPELHELIATKAMALGISLNKYVESAVKRATMF
ncbi:antitoxin HicB [Clostridia bacterium]|nr:antitoxin HicB [Clostridia bacterium]